MQQNPFQPPQNPYQPPQNQNPYAPQAQWQNQGMQPHGPVCPRCQSPNINKAGFTWWGGVLGPKLFNHTVCKQCGFGFNAKTGASNTRAIAIYLTVVSIVTLGLVFGTFSAGVFD